MNTKTTGSDSPQIIMSVNLFHVKPHSGLQRYHSTQSGLNIEGENRVIKPARTADGSHTLVTARYNDVP